METKLAQNPKPMPFKIMQLMGACNGPEHMLGTSHL